MCEKKISHTNDNQYSEEDASMNTTIERQEYKRLDFSKLNFSDIVVTAEEALRDVNPFKWSDDVLLGKKKVIIQKTEDK